ncbi:MAG: hypothetical protein ACODAJ_14610, partial [Planctomycetota bacterium]
MRTTRDGGQAVRGWGFGLAVVLVTLAAGRAGLGATSDHVFSALIYQGQFFDDPDAQDPSYSFSLEVETSTTVSLVEFQTPAGHTFQIPKQEHTEDGDIETEWWQEDGHYVWVYEGEFDSDEPLGDYGDGDYVITAHLDAGGQVQTTVPFTAANGTDPLAHPTQKPDWLNPTNLSSQTSPVTFSWSAVTDPTVTVLALMVEDPFADEDVYDHQYFPSATASDPVPMSPGLYMAELLFANGREGTNADNVEYTVAKGMATEVNFAVNTGAEDTIEIGGERWNAIAQPQEVDEYTFTATAGQELVVDVDAMAIGSQLDSFLLLHDPAQNVIVWNDDGADIAGDFYVDLNLWGERTGNAGTPEYGAEVEVGTLDSRLYFTAPQTGTYTVALGDYDNIQEGLDGTWGEEAYYRLRVLEATALPQSDLENTTVTLTKPGGGTETLAYASGLYGNHWWDAYVLEVTDTQANLQTRFPDGAYTARADFPGGGIVERPFDLGGPWPDFPVVQSPSHGATDVPEPVVAAWQQVVGADTMELELSTAAGDVWDEWLAGTATSVTVPEDATEAGEPHTLSVAALSGHESPALDVYKSSETLVEFTPGDWQVADHVLGVEIETAWDYDDPADPDDLTYEFEVTVRTDDTVERIEFLTPAGHTYEIPPDPFTSNGPIVTEHYVEDGAHVWTYATEFTDPADLDDYGDGTYTLTVHHQGGQAQTTAWFGIPGTADPIPQPTQEPILTKPTHLGTAVEPPTLVWEACTDAAASQIEVDCEAPTIFRTAYEAFDTTATFWPYAPLRPGQWECELAFDNAYQATNPDGIPVTVDKYSEADYAFTVTPSPWAFEVWGGETDFSGLPQSWTYYYNISQQDYTFLGGANGTATFSGHYTYYVIAARRDTQVDAVRGSTGDYYSGPLGTGNTDNPDNVLGAPDGQVASLPMGNTAHAYDGFILLTSPGDWDTITVLADTAEANT